MAEAESLLTPATTTTATPTMTPTTTAKTTTTVKALVEERIHCPTQPRQPKSQHNRSVSSASTIHDMDVNKIEEENDEYDAEEGQESLPFLCHCQHRPAISTTSSMTSATATMRSTTSTTLSACSCATTMSSSQRLGFGHSCDQNLDSTTSSLLRSKNNNSSNSNNTSSLLRKNSKKLNKKAVSSNGSTSATQSEDEDSILRYSFKGGPPEMYSAKKEFIYKRPLVEKQLVLKKTCEWWFYKTKCSNMSTHSKQNVFLLLTTGILILLGLIIFFCLPVNEQQKHATDYNLTMLQEHMPHGSSSSSSSNSNWTILTTTTTTTINPITSTTIKQTIGNIDVGGDVIRIEDGGGGDGEDGNEDADDDGEVEDVASYEITEVTTMLNETLEEVDWNTEDDDMENDIDNIHNSIPEELTSDYVTPIKVDNFKLNDDDLLYESKRNLSHNDNDHISAFSKTGTFRSKSSQIWDPHPEYILNIFNHQLHLILHQDTSFIPPKTFRVINYLNNHTEEEEDQGEGHYLGCYYKGYVEGDDQSTVAVSLCHGMTGYIKTSFGSLLIQPVSNQIYDTTLTSPATSSSASASASATSYTNASTTSEILHKVWRHSSRNARHAVSALDMDLQAIQQSLEATKANRRRQKRNTDENIFTIELLVAVDRTMKEFHKDDLTSYILTLISIVSNIFSDASIGNSINISVANILVLQNFRQPRRRGRTTASQSLKEFCTHVDKSSYHYDTAMLITRDQICRQERETKCDTLGLAELGTVCSRKSCSIVQDNGLPAAFTIAHELGHVLNMPHDDDDRCKQFDKPGQKRKLHIMSSVMGDDIHPWSWSDCSRYYVSEFLEKLDTSCLEDTPTKFIRNYNTRLPGEIYSLDHQCRLVHGNQSRYCDYGQECNRLWCKTPTNQCQSTNLPWADGTPCNQNRYWCDKGECVPREGHVRHILNGGWGAWSPWSPCSLTCGGGVQESKRECNSPFPKNGGKYCTGARKKYRSCSTQNCPIGSMDAREEQCYRMNGRDLGIQGISRSIKWIPKYGLSSKDLCNLYCRAEGDSSYFRLSDKVVDGTTCSFDSFDKCINGICRPAGCDNELNSIAKLDRCGICEGRNDTCEEVNGRFTISNLHSSKTHEKQVYYPVTMIPKGASNIVIEQPGCPKENYIVLKTDQGKSIINGDLTISGYRNVSFYAGTAFEYNGSNSPVEKIISTYTRKLKRDLVVEILSMISPSCMDNLLVTYSYTLDKSNYVEEDIEIYRWEMQQWSTCDALCDGNIHRSAVCLSTTQALKVSPQFCESQVKPPTEYRSCNTDCQLTLNVTGISECSASCGMLGTREKTYHCIQTFPDMDRSNIVDIKYCEAKYEIKTHEECREGCWNYTEWSMCSGSCGYGIQTRRVICNFNQTVAPDDYCNLKTKANLRDIQRVCTLDPCPVYTTTELAKSARNMPNYWWAGDWGHCDDKCEKNRTVICRSPFGNTCPESTKPLGKRKCCNIKYVSSWSTCSVQCGNGIRRKEMNCARVYKPEIKGTPRRRELIDPSYCQHLRVPKPKRMEKPCKVSCKWSVSNWTQCPADCSEEYQNRSVYCESVFGNPINHTYCDESKKPPERKICNNCVKRQSKQISNCNCEGFRRSRIFCYDSAHTRIECPTREKIIREKCTPPRHCYPTSCYDIRRFRRTYDDREFTIFVRSKPIKVYCHDMRNSPKEFITLNSTENYSIYYDVKTTNPDLCPPESRHREYRDNSSKSGRTTFRKIRVDITTLRVYDNDFTFAETIGTPQPYGSGGDCYNRRRQCPHGDFSINLENTGFLIRHGTVWEPYGHQSVMKELTNSRTSYRALCGGWCGGCKIAPNSALYLDV